MSHFSFVLARQMKSTLAVTTESREKLKRREPHKFTMLICCGKGKGQPAEHLRVKTKDPGSLYISLTENTLICRMILRHHDNYTSNKEAYAHEETDKRAGDRFLQDEGLHRGCLHCRHESRAKYRSGIMNLSSAPFFPHFLPLSLHLTDIPYTRPST